MKLASLLACLRHVVGAIVVGQKRVFRVNRRRSVPSAISVPVRDKIVRDTEQPGREWNRLHLVAVNVIHRLEESTRRQILGVGYIAGSVIDVVVNPPKVALVQSAERLATVARPN